MRTNFFCTSFLNTPSGLGHPAKFQGHPRFLPSKPKEDKLLREGTNFLTTKPFAWKTPTPPSGLRTQKFIFVRGQNWTQTFVFSNFSGTPGISQQNPGISRQKSLISLVSRDISNFLTPTPSCGRPLPHRKRSGLKSLGLCSFCFSDLCSFFWPDFQMSPLRGAAVASRQQSTECRRRWLGQQQTLFFVHACWGGRQRSGEGVVRRNGCPKGCFWRVRLFSAPSRFSGPFRCFKSKP